MSDLVYSRVTCVGVQDKVTEIRNQLRQTVWAPTLLGETVRERLFTNPHFMLWNIESPALAEQGTYISNKPTYLTWNKTHWGTANDVVNCIVVADRDHAYSVEFATEMVAPELAVMRLSVQNPALDILHETWYPTGSGSISTFSAGVPRLDYLRSPAVTHKSYEGTPARRACDCRSVPTLGASVFPFPDCPRDPLTTEEAVLAFDGVGF